MSLKFSSADDGTNLHRFTGNVVYFSNIGLHVHDVLIYMHIIDLIKPTSIHKNCTIEMKNQWRLCSTHTILNHYRTFKHHSKPHTPIICLYPKSILSVCP